MFMGLDMAKAPELTAVVEEPTEERATRQQESGQKRAAAPSLQVVEEETAERQKDIHKTHPY